MFRGWFREGKKSYCATRHQQGIHTIAVRGVAVSWRTTRTRGPVEQAVRRTRRQKGRTIEIGSEIAIAMELRAAPYPDCGQTPQHAISSMHNPPPAVHKTPSAEGQNTTAQVRWNNPANSSGGSMVDNIPGRAIIANCGASPVDTVVVMGQTGRASQCGIR